MISLWSTRLVLHQAVLFAHSRLVSTTNFPNGTWKEVLILKSDLNLMYSYPQGTLEQNPICQLPVSHI